MQCKWILGGMLPSAGWEKWINACQELVGLTIARENKKQKKNSKASRISLALPVAHELKPSFPRFHVTRSGVQRKNGGALSVIGEVSKFRCYVILWQPGLWKAQIFSPFLVEGASHTSCNSSRWWAPVGFQNPNQKGSRILRNGSLQRSPAPTPSPSWRVLARRDSPGNSFSRSQRGLGQNRTLGPFGGGACVCRSAKGS